MAGLALGSSSGDAEKSLLLAILAHKSVAAFALEKLTCYCACCVFVTLFYCAVSRGPVALRMAKLAIDKGVGLSLRDGLAFEQPAADRQLLEAGGRAAH